MQKAVTEFTSTCGNAKIYVDNTMPIGVFHDFLMTVKGAMVERMIAAHKAHEKEIADQQSLPPHESEISAREDIAEQPTECAQEWA